MRACLLALLCGTAAIAQDAAANRFALDAGRIREHVRVLAADDLQGRGNGSAGLRDAARYIAAEFERAGLEPGGDGGTYLQAFDISARLASSDTGLTVAGGGDEVPFRIGVHYYPLSVPDAGSPRRDPLPPATGLAFAGYGIVAPDLSFDEYAGLDVRGRAVIVLTHEPQEDDPDSVFDGRALTPHSDLARKAALARDRGARALLVVEDPSHATDRALTAAWAGDPQIDDYGMPVLRVDRDRLDRALPDLDLRRRAREIDATLQPRSAPVAGATMTAIASWLDVGATVANVVGVLPGRDRDRDGDVVVVGGHYDHLGVSGRFSRDARGDGRVHNGADDNASGIAVILEMARAAVRHADAFRRGVVFVAFAGEELGLLGSRHFVEHRPPAARRVAGMINLDMVGRARGRVLVGGQPRLPPLDVLIRDLRPLTPLRLDDFAEGYGDGASDNASFEREQIPSVVFFTGFHEDYHRPSDDWDRIDAAGAAEIGRLALAVTARLSRR